MEGLWYTSIIVLIWMDCYGGPVVHMVERICGVCYREDKKNPPMALARHVYYIYRTHVLDLHSTTVRVLHLARSRTISHHAALHVTVVLAKLVEVVAALVQVGSIAHHLCACERV